MDDLKKAIETTDYAQVLCVCVCVRACVRSSSQLYGRMQVTVVVADDADESVHHEVLAHPCFLALSPFFRAILQSGMKEAQERRIELTEVTRDCFLLVLEFLHTGTRTTTAHHHTKLTGQRALQAYSPISHLSTRSRCCASATSTTFRRTCAR